MTDPVFFKHAREGLTLPVGFKPIPHIALPQMLALDYMGAMLMSLLPIRYRSWYKPNVDLDRGAALSGLAQYVGCLVVLFIRYVDFMQRRLLDLGGAAVARGQEEVHRSIGAVWNGFRCHAGIRVPPALLASSLFNAGGVGAIPRRRRHPGGSGHDAFVPDRVGARTIKESARSVTGSGPRAMGEVVWVVARTKFFLGQKSPSYCRSPR